MDFKTVAAALGYTGLWNIEVTDIKMSMHVEQFSLGKEESDETRDITCPITREVGYSAGICAYHQSSHLPPRITGT